MIPFKGERLRQIRKASKLTLQKLKSLTGINISTLSDLENNKIPFPRKETIEKLCKGLHMNAEFFYLGVSEELDVPQVPLADKFKNKDTLHFLLYENSVEYVELAKEIKDKNIPIVAIKAFMDNFPLLMEAVIKKCNLDQGEDFTNKH